MDIQVVRQAAFEADYVEVYSNSNTNNNVIAFRHYDYGCRIDVYYKTSTVITTLEHMFLGTLKYCRLNVDINDLIALFEMPLIHSGEEYYHSILTTNQNYYSVDATTNTTTNTINNIMSESSALIDAISNYQNQVNLLQNQLNYIKSKNICSSNAYSSSYNDSGSNINNGTGNSLEKELLITSIEQRMDDIVMNTHQRQQLRQMNGNYFRSNNNISGNSGTNGYTDESKLHPNTYINDMPSLDTFYPNDRNNGTESNEVYDIDSGDDVDYIDNDKTQYNNYQYNNSHYNDSTYNNINDNRNAYASSTYNNNNNRSNGVSSISKNRYNGSDDNEYEENYSGSIKNIAGSGTCSNRRSYSNSSNIAATASNSDSIPINKSNNRRYDNNSSNNNNNNNNNNNISNISSSMINNNEETIGNNSNYNYNSNNNRSNSNIKSCNSDNHDNKKNKSSRSNSSPSRSSNKTDKGTKFVWSLVSSKHFPENVSEIKSVALTRGGFVCIGEDGYACYSGIPYNVRDCIEKLKCRKLKYISIGPPKRSLTSSVTSLSSLYQYYVVRTDGKAYFENLPKDLVEVIVAQEVDVKLLALGSYHTYYVLFENGQSQWNGNIDGSLTDIFQNHRVKNVYIGPGKSSYFVLYDDDRIAYKNIPNKDIKKYCNSTSKNVKQILYDDETDSYFIRYSPKV